MSLGLMKTSYQTLCRIWSAMFNINLLEIHNGFKLQIELVPNGCWYTNVRSNVTKRQWDTIRKDIYQKAGYLCEICGGIGSRHPVECHEIWSYDIPTRIQKLEKLEALCPLCHEVKHFGFASERGFRLRALRRFSKINDISLEEAEEIIHVVLQQWQERSLLDWTLDISLLKKYGIGSDNENNPDSDYPTGYFDRLTTI